MESGGLGYSDGGGALNLYLCLLPEEVELMGAPVEAGGGSNWEELAVEVVVGTCAARACWIPVWILSSTLTTTSATASKSATLRD